jgi:hypothetical protein
MRISSRSMWVQSVSRLLALLSFLASSVSGNAQIVRGTVADRTTGQPASGVVTLERLTADSAIVESRSVLTGSDGSFSVRAGSPGLARLYVRRIGAIPFRSEILSLADGEVVVVAVQLERVPPPGARTGSTLGRVFVRRGTPCRSNDNGEYIATLWDDARTALMATEIAAKENKATRRVVRYIRELDSPSLKVFAESLHAFDGTDGEAGAFFRSRSGEQLSRDGYWYEDRDRAVWFFGPDASALLSEAFVQDHCFRLGAASDNSDGLIRLAFEPIPARTREYSPTEIAGIVKFDSATSELRQLEFDWVKLHADTSLVGGELHFAYDSGGFWYVSSWRLRMPREVLLVSGQGVARRQTLLEEGGIVLDDLPVSGFVPGTITGIVRDSKGKGLSEATVRVIGAEVRTRTDMQGRYSLTGVPPGLQFVVVDHESYQDFGIRVGQQRALITEGVSRELTFAAPSREVIATALCGQTSDLTGIRRDANTAILRVSLSRRSRDSVSSETPQIRLAVTPTSRGPDYVVTQRLTPDGSAVFCDAPAGIALILTDPRSPNVVLATLRLRRGELVAWVDQKERRF